MTQASETDRGARLAPAGGGRGGKHPSRRARIVTFNRQVVAELHKVVWPTRSELLTYTAVSIIFVVFMIAFVALLDYAFTKLVFHVFG